MIRKLAERLYSAGEGLGVASAIRNSSWRRSRLLVLCWHGISLDDEHLWRPGLYITPDLFRLRLSDLAEGGYTVLPLDEALGRLWSGDLPPRSAAITFDDGFYDFYRHAVPALEEFGFPATLYLTTYYVDYQRPLFNLMVSYMLWKSMRPGLRLPDGSPLTNQAEAGSATDSTVEQAKLDGATGAQKDELARALAHDLELDYDALVGSRVLQLMSAEEVRQAAESPLITIESHTHRHRTPADLQLMNRELRDNQDRIQALTGRRPVHFCYPSGIYREDYFPLLEQEGFKSATTCHMRIATASDHRYLMPRFLDHMGVSDVQFRGWLSGMRALGRSA